MTNSPHLGVRLEAQQFYLISAPVADLFQMEASRQGAVLSVGPSYPMLH